MTDTQEVAAHLKAGCAFAEELYVIEDTIEVVANIGGESRSVRIEMLFDVQREEYTTRAHVLEDYTVQATYPKTAGRFDREPESRRIWAGFDFPWTLMPTAEMALSQALDFLRESCSDE
jgi:t-SNARE complex subunit (syntaxin)